MHRDHDNAAHPAAPEQPHDGFATGAERRPDAREDRGGAALDTVDHELQCLDVLGRVERRRPSVVGQHPPAVGERDLEEVDGEPLVPRSLIDDAGLPACGGVDLLPRPRLLVDLVGAVVEEPGVGLLGHAPVLAVVVRGGERRRDELVLALLDDRREVVEPLLRGELGGPDHVGVEDVAVGRARLLALDELGALLVRRRGKLHEPRAQPLVGEAVVELPQRRALRPRGVLPGAESTVPVAPSASDGSMTLAPSVVAFGGAPALPSSPPQAATRTAAMRVGTIRARIGVLRSGSRGGSVTPRSRLRGLRTASDPGAGSALQLAARGAHGQLPEVEPALEDVDAESLVDPRDDVLPQVRGPRLDDDALA